jgi:hypothetical protein
MIVSKLVREANARMKTIVSFARLLGCHLLHPIYGFVTKHLGHGHMGHGRIWSGAMPVFHTRRNPDDVANLDHFDRTSPLLNPTLAFRNDQCLTERMGMPGRSGTGFEMDDPSTDA